MEPVEAARIGWQIARRNPDALSKRRPNAGKFNEDDTTIAGRIILAIGTFGGTAPTQYVIEIVGADAPRIRALIQGAKQAGLLREVNGLLELTGAVRESIMAAEPSPEVQEAVVWDPSWHHHMPAKSWLSRFLTRVIRRRVRQRLEAVTPSTPPAPEQFISHASVDVDQIFNLIGPPPEGSRHKKVPSPSLPVGAS